MIVPNDVIRVSDPNASWRLIGIEKTPRTTNVNNEITLDQILSLSGIFNEDCVAHSMVCDIVLHSEVMNTMNGHSSVESVMNRIVSHVRRVHSTNHMEVNWVTTKDEGLSHICQFDTVNSSSSCLIARRVHDDDGTVLFIR